MATQDKDRRYLTAALYNTSLLTLTACCVCALVGGYYLFYDFVKPLTWAVISGIVLYPLKRKMTTVVKKWLDSLSLTRTPLIFGVVCLPVSIIDGVGDVLIAWIENNSVAVFLVGCSIPMTALMVQGEFLPKLLLTGAKFVARIDRGVSFATNWVALLLLPLTRRASAYAEAMLLKRNKVAAAIVCFQLYVLLCSLLPSRFRKVICVEFLCNNVLLSWFAWAGLFAFACNHVGPFRGVAFVAGIAILAARMIAKNWHSAEDNKGNTPRIVDGQHGYVGRGAAAGSLSESLMKKSTLSSSTISGAQIDDEDGGDVYLKWLMISCFFVYVSLHLWLLLLILLPLVFAVAKRLIISFRLVDVWKSGWHLLRETIHDSGADEMILPEPVVEAYNMFLRIIRGMKRSMDTVGSIVAMVLLGVGIVAISVFLSCQLYYESLHMLTLAADIANRTVMHNEPVQLWLQDTFNVSSVPSAFDKLLEKGTVSGKIWLSGHIRDVIDDESKAELLEEQLLSTFDLVYHKWMQVSPNTSSTAIVSSSSDSVLSGWSRLWATLGSDLEGDSLMDFGAVSNIASVITDNLALLRSFFESGLKLFASNAEVIMGGVSQVFGTLLASGSAVVDLLLDTIVFLTILFQLLCSSDKQFKPFEVLDQLTPNANEISAKISAAVSGVFIVSLKMATFYALYTWLTHTLFNITLIFIPSLLAGILAAVPFFGTHLVAIPAVLELWLVRGEPFLALFLLVLHVLPSYVIDDAIYEEIG